MSSATWLKQKRPLLQILGEYSCKTPQTLRELVVCNSFGQCFAREKRQIWDLKWLDR